MTAPSPTQFFPFPPDWKTPFAETLGFNSWVTVAEDRSETTGSRSGNRPRRSFEYVLTTRQSKHTQRVRNLIASWQGRFFEVPHWAEKSKLTAPVAAGADILFLDTSGLTLVAGQRVALYRSVDSYELATVESFDASTITLTANLFYDWPAGTKVYSVFYAILDAGQSVEHITDNKSRTPVKFYCEPSVTEPNTGDGAAAATLYLGEELYVHHTNWVNGLSFAYQSDREFMDRGTNKFRIKSVSQYSPPAREHTWHLKGREAVLAFRSWLGRREGQARPVYMPSGVDDFTVVVAPVAGNTWIDTETNQYGELLAAHPAFRDIIILLRDGTSITRRITDVDAITAVKDRLNFADPLPSNIALRDIKRVSFLGFYRQTEPSTTIRWITDTVAVASMDMSLKPTPVE